MVEKEKFDKVAPVFQNKSVISLKINEKKIPLKKEMPITFFTSKFLEAFSIIEEYVDFSIIFEDDNRIENWSKGELHNFLETLSEAQQEIIKIITKEETITRDNLVEQLNEQLDNEEFLNNKSLAGIVAGLNSRINRLKKEKFFNIHSNNYKINETYTKFLKEIYF